jgi:hypothetical protein
MVHRFDVMRVGGWCVVGGWAGARVGGWVVVAGAHVGRVAQQADLP